MCHFNHILYNVNNKLFCAIVTPNCSYYRIIFLIKKPRNLGICGAFK